MSDWTFVLLNTLDENVLVYKSHHMLLEFCILRRLFAQNLDRLLIGEFRSELARCCSYLLNRRVNTIAVSMTLAYYCLFVIRACS